MTKLFALVFAFGILWLPSAQGMPLVPLAQTQAGPAIQVSSGCGLGVRRGLGGECVPVYYDANGNHWYHRANWRGSYRGYHSYYRGYRHPHYPYVRYSNNTGVVVVDKGVCGFGSYLVCDYGTCWRRCY